MRIFLIGFMGVGKSTLGQLLAEELQMPFVDLDEWIEEKMNMPIKTVFEEYGEPFFRKLEHDNLHEVVETYDRFVMATGGGLPCFSGNMKYMSANGLSIYLKASTEDIVRRLRNSHGKRPVLDRMDRDQLAEHIGKLLDEREEFYSLAKETILLKLKYETEDNVAKIIAICKRYLD